MAKSKDKSQATDVATTAEAVEYVRWVHPEERIVMGYGHLQPGSVHRVKDLPGNPLGQLGVTFEPATLEDFEASGVNVDTSKEVENV